MRRDLYLHGRGVLGSPIAHLLAPRISSTTVDKHEDPYALSAIWRSLYYLLKIGAIMRPKCVCAID